MCAAMWTIFDSILNFAADSNHAKIMSIVGSNIMYVSMIRICVIDTVAKKNIQKVKITIFIYSIDRCDVGVISNILLHGSMHACNVNTKSIKDVIIQNVSYRAGLKFIIIIGIHF